MGSHSFEDVYHGPLSVKEAYSELVEQARLEYGHDPYNGTISTTGGVHLVQTQPVTHEEAVKLAETRIDKLSKWEQCEAIPLVVQTPAEYVTLADTEVGLVVSGAVYNDPALLQQAARKALRLGNGVEITECSLKIERPSFNRVARVDKRVVAEVPKEPAETRYFILTGVGKIRGDDLDWEKGHPTQAAARAALETVLRYDYHGIPDVQAEIVGLVRRASGAPLVKATVSAKKITGTFVVKTRREIKAATVGTERAGYYFYGWAAS